MVSTMLKNHFIQQKEKNRENKNYIGTLMIIYLTSVLVRFFIAIIEVQPHIMSDELSYTSMAYNFYKTHSFNSLINYGAITNLSNILYQFIISPSFLFGDNFYICIKLINCILVSLIILPGYLILKEYLTKEKAILYSAITILMPFNNITSFAMAENLYIPLFLFSFYFSYKMITQHKNYYIIGTSILLSLLFLTKPHAIALILAVFATEFIMVIYYAIRKNEEDKKKAIECLIKAILCFIVIFMLSTLIIKGELSVASIVGTGYSKGVMNTNTVFPIIEFLKMTIAHITITNILYFIPLVVCAYSFIDEVKKKNEADYNKIVLIILTILAFISCLIMTLKFSIVIYKDERFTRLHFRYYYMTFACLYYVCICFIEKINLNIVRKSIIIISYFTINIINVLFSVRKYINEWSTLSDNMDMYVLATKNIIIIGIIIILSIFSLMKFVNNKQARKGYILFYIIFSLLANMTLIQNKVKVMNPYWTTFNSNRSFVAANIEDKNAKVVIFEVGHENRTNIAFWLHYNYTNIVELSVENNKITSSMIPNNSEYIVVFGDVCFDFDIDKYRKIEKTPKCYIIQLTNNSAK